MIPINIATAFNQKYSRYAYVMMLSAFANNEYGSLHMYAMHSGLENNSVDDMRKLAEEYGDEITFIHITDDMLPEELPSSEQWSKEAYFRLFMSDLLPDTVSRVLYLDVDIIVNGSVAELFELDMEGCPIAACEDVSRTPFGDDRDLYFGELLAQGYKYFCSGVALFNMDIMRKRYHFEDYLRLAERLNYQMVAFDQDLLNLMHWQEVGYLDGSKWELFAKLAYNHDIHYDQVRNEAAIVHFAGEKPWEGQYVHYDIQKLWWDYAARSPYYHEFLEEFVIKAVTDPYIYDTLEKSAEEKKALRDKLDESLTVCRKIMDMYGK